MVSRRPPPSSAHPVPNPRATACALWARPLTVEGSMSGYIARYGS